MTLLNFFREKIPQNSAIRRMYHYILAVIGAFWYRFPARHLKVIGVTGTKGKTTACHLIADVLAASGSKVGMVTTLQFRIGNKKWSNKTKQTTLGRFALQRLLRKMVNEKCEYAVVEVSSISLTQSRLWGITVDAAVLTNIQRDHIEYHGSYKKYIEAKQKLFKGLYSSKRKTGVDKVMVLPRDDKEYNGFATFLSDRAFTFGRNRRAEVKPTNIEHFAHGSIFTISLPNHTETIHLPLPGNFNVDNALSAVCVGLGFGIPLKDIKKGLEGAASVPGRVESIVAGQKFSVIVDYAHTEESLKLLLELFKPLTPGRLIAVFGCTGGGRDKKKRPKMGAVADKLADLVVLTDDDPYVEDRFEIIDQIAGGIKRKEGKDFWKIVNRKEAIRFALTQAKEGDTVIIAGKGGEEVMAIDGKLIPWNDSVIVREFLEREVRVHIPSKSKDTVVAVGENKCFSA